MKISFAVAAVAAATLLSQPAQSALVTVEPDAFANGTDISTAFAGVTLSTVRTGANPNVPTSTGAVFSVTDSNASSGARGFGQSAGDSTWGNGSFEYLLAVFNTDVFSVSLDFFANDSNDGNAQFLAFDQFGALVDSQLVGSVASGAPVTLTVTGSIRSVRAYWDEINRNENGGLDNLRYESAAVPEPASMLLVCVALLAAGAATRRRTP